MLNYLISVFNSLVSKEELQRIISVEKPEDFISRLKLGDSNLPEVKQEFYNWMKDLFDKYHNQNDSHFDFKLSIQSILDTERRLKNKEGYLLPSHSIQDIDLIFDRFRQKEKEDDLVEDMA